MQQRLLEQFQAVDPHLRGAEGMHPGNDADTVVIIVCGANRGDDFLRIAYRRHPDDLGSELSGLIQGGDDGPGVRSNLPQGLFSIEILTPGDEINLSSVHNRHLLHVCGCNACQ